MTDKQTLIALAERCEAATGPAKELDRAIALAAGWVRQTPSEAGRRHPAWFHPSDCRDGRVIMDSLHGTDVWRDPLAYTASLDAAMTLVPEGYGIYTRWSLHGRETRTADAILTREVSQALGEEAHYFAEVATIEALGCKTLSLALCAAALRARAAQ